MQTCNGAYYAYWVTVWAEDANGILSELSGHGLKTSGGGAFKGSTTYEFITDVPLEKVKFNGTSTSFSNNVGMHKKVFTILPAGNGAVADTGPGELTVDFLTVIPTQTVLGEPVVVSAQVISQGSASPGATVVFSDGDPENGGEVFDAELLPHIRADDTHFVRVNYNPDTCGIHEIFVEVTGASRRLGTEEVAAVDVGIDLDSAIDFLISEVKELDLVFPKKVKSHRKLHWPRILWGWQKRHLIRKLRLARRAIEAGRIWKGVHLLEGFNHQVEGLKHRGRIDPDKAYGLLAQSDRIIGCVR